MILFPYGHKNPPDRFPAASLVLIGLNVFIFFITSEYGMIREDIVEQWAVSRGQFNPITITTAAFLHGDFMHLLGNMWFLFIFGFAVEGRLKTPKFLLLYALAALGSAGLEIATSTEDIPMIGASGAIMGLMGAALYLFPFAKVKVFYWLFIVFVGTWMAPMWGIALIFFAMDLFWAGLGTVGGSDGVAHFAHVGGCLVGAAVPILLRARRDSANVSEAKAVLTDFKDLSALNPHQLYDLVKMQPDDPALALAWMGAELNYQVVSAEALEHFKKHFKAIATDGDLRAVGSVVHNLAHQGYMLNPSGLMAVATRCERESLGSIAFVLYDQVMRNPQSSDHDKELATFRLANLHERQGDRQTALYLYGQYLNNWPLGAMEGTVRSAVNRMAGGPLS